MRIKGEDGVYVRGKKVKTKWKCHFECLLYDKTERETTVSSVDVEVDDNCVNMQKETNKNLYGKAAGVDGITAEK